MGFIILIKGADFFIDGSSNLALNLGVPKIVIALTIVAFGTSLPELGVSIEDITTYKGNILLGNVVGSNIMNILLILGITSLIKKIEVNKDIIKKELPMMLIITVLFGVLLINNDFSKIDGFILLGFFLIFYIYLISRSKKNTNTSEELSIKKSLLYTLVGIIGVILGSHTVVNSSVIISKLLGINERVIALTIVAFGTSLPELITSLSALKKEEYELLIGNVLGSNIFNIGIVLSLPVIIFGSLSKISITYIDILVMLVSSILLFILCIKKNELSKKEGLIFLVIFIIYYSYISIS